MTLVKRTLEKWAATKSIQKISKTYLYGTISSFPFWVAIAVIERRLVTGRHADAFIFANSRSILYRIKKKKMFKKLFLKA